jgi:CO dehydrogenase nickel-insertion accessory protein CooC1
MDFHQIGILVVVVLYKVDDAVCDVMTRALEAEQIIAVIPKSDRLFMQSLRGEPLDTEITEVDKICDFIDTFEKPVSLAVL